MPHESLGPGHRRGHYGTAGGSPGLGGQEAGVAPGLGSLTGAESLKSRLLQWPPFLTVTDYVLNKYLRID